MSDPATDIFLGSFLSSLQKSQAPLQQPAAQMTQTPQVPNVLGRAGQQPAAQVPVQGPVSAPSTPQKAEGNSQNVPQIDPRIIQQALALQAILAGGGGIQGVANLMGVPLAQQQYSPFPTMMSPQGLAQQSWGVLPQQLQLPELQALFNSTGYLPPAVTGNVGQNPKMQQQYQFGPELLGPAIAALAALAGGA